MPLPPPPHCALLFIPRHSLICNETKFGETWLPVCKPIASWGMTPLPCWCPRRALSRVMASDLLCGPVLSQALKAKPWIGALGSVDCQCSPGAPACPSHDYSLIAVDMGPAAQQPKRAVPFTPGFIHTAIQFCTIMMCVDGIKPLKLQMTSNNESMV